MTVTSDTAPKKPLLKRPWVWVASAVIAAIIYSNVMSFPAGKYNCTWSGDRPTGELAGDLSVTVGAWPGTFPLKARIYTATGPVGVSNWTHAHSTYSREFNAVIPIGSDSYQALCELD